MTFLSRSPLSALIFLVLHLFLPLTPAHTAPHHTKKEVEVSYRVLLLLFGDYSMFGESEMLFEDGRSL
jgi:hypothetical protein